MMKKSSSTKQNQSPTRQETAKHRLENIQQLKIKKQNYQDEITQFLKEITQYCKAEKIYAYTGLGSFYKKIGQLEQAIRYFSLALDLDSKNIHALRGRALCYVDSKNNDKAIKDLNELLNRNKNDDIGLLTRARCFQIINRHEEAIKDYHHFIEIYDQDSSGYLGLGRCYEEMSENNGCKKIRREHYNKALKVYDDLLEHFPKDYEGLISRGRLKDKLKIADGLNDYLQCTKLNPKNVRGWQSLARCYQDLHQHSKAIAAYTEALTQNPNDLELLLDRSRCYEEIAQYDLELKDICLILKNNKLNETILHRRACCHKAMGNYSKAIEDYKQLITIDTKNQAYQLALTFCYEAAGKIKEGESLYSSILKQNPHDTKILLSYIRFLEHFCKHKEVKEQFEKALSNNKTNREINLTLAIYNEKQGQYDLSLGIYNGLLHLSPHDKECLLNKIRCYQEMGDYENAIKGCDLYITQYGKDKLILLAQAHLYSLVRHKDTEKCYKYLIDTYQQDKICLLSWARYLETVPRYQEALKVYGGLLEKLQNDKQILISRARCHEHFNNKNGARKDYELLMERYPNDPEVLLSHLIFERCFSIINHSDSIKEFNKLIRQFPNSAAIYLSYLNFINTKHDSAIEEKFIAGIEKFPFDEKFYSAIVRYYYQNLNYQQAEKYFDKALLLFPYSQHIHYEMIAFAIAKNTKVAESYDNFMTTFPFSYLWHQNINKLLRDNKYDYLIPKDTIILDEDTNNQTFDIKLLPAEIWAIYNILKKISVKDHVYLFGGSVRDYVMGKIPKDHDLIIVTSLSLFEVAKKLPQNMINYSLNEEKNLIQLKINNLLIDIVVVPSENFDLKKYAESKDFYCNSLFINLAKPTVIIDHTEKGVKHAKEKIISIITTGEQTQEKRYSEDLSRVFRAILLLAKGFALANDDKVAILRAIEKKDIVAHIGPYIKRLFTKGQAHEFYLKMSDLKIFNHIFFANDIEINKEREMVIRECLKNIDEIANLLGKPIDEINFYDSLYFEQKEISTTINFILEPSEKLKLYNRISPPDRSAPNENINETDTKMHKDYQKALKNSDKAKNASNPLLTSQLIARNYNPLTFRQPNSLLTPASPEDLKKQLINNK